MLFKMLNFSEQLKVSWLLEKEQVDPLLIFHLEIRLINSFGFITKITYLTGFILYTKVLFTFWVLVG